MPEPLTVIAPTKSLYDMLTSRHGLMAFSVAGVQTGMFMVVVWVGGWGFAREWGTVAMWLVFLMCSAVVLLAWAYHVYRDAEDRRDRASTLELHRMSQEVLASRREAFGSDESFYKARKDWATERDALMKEIENRQAAWATLSATALRLNERSQQADWMEPRLKAAEEWLDGQGKRIVTSLPSNTAEVQDKPT